MGVEGAPAGLAMAGPLFSTTHIHCLTHVCARYCQGIDGFNVVFSVVLSRAKSTRLTFPSDHSAKKKTDCEEELPIHVVSSLEVAPLQRCNRCHFCHICGRAEQEGKLSSGSKEEAFLFRIQ